MRLRQGYSLKVRETWNRQGYSLAHDYSVNVRKIWHRSVLSPGKENMAHTLVLVQCKKCGTESEMSVNTHSIESKVQLCKG